MLSRFVGKLLKRGINFQYSRMAKLQPGRVKCAFQNLIDKNFDFQH